jgi:hypothetical protein
MEIQQKAGTTALFVAVLSAFFVDVLDRALEDHQVRAALAG